MRTTSELASALGVRVARADRIGRRRGWRFELEALPGGQRGWASKRKRWDVSDDQIAAARAEVAARPAGKRAGAKPGPVAGKRARGARASGGVALDPVSEAVLAETGPAPPLPEDPSPEKAKRSTEEPEQGGVQSPRAFPVVWLAVPLVVVGLYFAVQSLVLRPTPEPSTPTVPVPVEGAQPRVAAWRGLR